MRYSSECAWKAVEKFCPHLLAAHPGSVQLPEAMKECAVSLFLMQNCLDEDLTDKQRRLRFDFHTLVVFEALKELREKGYIEFGTENAFL